MVLAVARESSSFLEGLEANTNSSQNGSVDTLEAPDGCSSTSIMKTLRLNNLLVLVPVSWITYFTCKRGLNPDVPLFIFSFLAMMPLVKVVDFIVDELSRRGINQTKARVIGITLANWSELIIGIIALRHNQYAIIRATVLGSILGNLLLGLGICMFVYGVKFQQEPKVLTPDGFGDQTALLWMSIVMLLVPTAFRFSTPAAATAASTLKISRAVAVILLFTYLGYLVFLTLLTSQRENAPAITWSKYAPRRKNISTAARDLEDSEHNAPDAEDDMRQQPRLKLWTTIVLLVVVTALMASTAEWLVQSIDGMADANAVSQQFIALFILPLASKFAERVSLIIMSARNEFSRCMELAIGASIQTALSMTPLLVTIGWVGGVPFSLLFDPYEAFALCLSVLIVKCVVDDDHAQCLLHGILLIGTYGILLVIFWFHYADTRSLANVRWISDFFVQPSSENLYSGH